jgi:hypothetical protein
MMVFSCNRAFSVSSCTVVYTTFTSKYKINKKKFNVSLCPCIYASISPNVAETAQDKQGKPGYIQRSVKERELTKTKGRTPARTKELSSAFGVVDMHNCLFSHQLSSMFQTKDKRCTVDANKWQKRRKGGRVGAVGVCDLFLMLV